MIPYLILIVTSLLIGLAAVLLYRRKDTRDPKVFLIAALANASVLLGILRYRKRKRQ